MKKIYKKPFLSIRLELVINFFASRLLINRKQIPYTLSFNMNNSNILKFITFLHHVIASITKIWPVAKAPI